MKYSLNNFNQLEKAKAQEALFNCCGSSQWVERLMALFPFKEESVLFEKANTIWYTQCREKDYLEAFKQHPQIGDVESLKKKFAATAEWAGSEQAGTMEASVEVIHQLAALNTKYLAKNSFIFIVCATGKPATEMLRLLEERLSHGREEEMAIAMGEQHKITLIRLKKLLQLKEAFWHKASQVTTHVLDTSIGIPGKGISIRLKKRASDKWQTMALGITNQDGRIADLLPPGITLEPGHYQMCFDTGHYFKSNKVSGFYPEVRIDFNTFDRTHYHVPLLINPFGYSTYRGS